MRSTCATWCAALRNSNGAFGGCSQPSFVSTRPARHRARGPAFGVVRAVRKTVERAGRQGYRKQRTGGHAPRSAGPSSPPPPQLDDLGGRGRHRVDDGLDPLRPVLQRLGLLVLIFMKVVGADDTGRPMCKDCFRDVVFDANADRPERTTRRKSWLTQPGDRRR